VRDVSVARWLGRRQICGNFESAPALPSDDCADLEITRRAGLPDSHDDVAAIALGDVELSAVSG
jgi:hypothetical protein